MADSNKHIFMPEKQLKGLIHQSLWYDASSLVGQPSGMMLQSIAYGSDPVGMKELCTVSDEPHNDSSERS